MRHREIELSDTEFKDCPEMGEPGLAVSCDARLTRSNLSGTTTC
jgi:hypothetical protein